MQSVFFVVHNVYDASSMYVCVSVSLSCSAAYVC